ncbi:MAG TPA: hypothetical protein VEQ41_00055 [Solirubrobacterales bacterium]|nr:hypothetical protein [Solirubrobacterales bacterium]
MELEQTQVDDFLAAKKVALGEGPVDWEHKTPELATWSAIVEVDAVRKGEVRLVANPRVDRAWSFMLLLHKTAVYRLEDQPPPARHLNRGCPESFPRRIGCEPHEHVWIRGRDLHCARPVDSLRDGDHHDFFKAFCERANLEFQSEYRPPEPPMQMLELGS